MVPPMTSGEQPAGRVRVPASTSNLGPGFDQLGLALQLYLEVEMRGPIDSPHHRFERLSGEATSWSSEDNLLPRAFDAVLERHGASSPRFEFEVHSEIPLCRGLGSSGAAIAAGLVLAKDWLQGDSITESELASLGSELDGHPDNSTASLIGGCTLGIPMSSGDLRVLRHELHPSLKFAVAYGPFRMPTSESREVLPRSLDLADVVWNLQRHSLLLAGLSTGDREVLREAARDSLHTPFRLPLIPGAEVALRRAEEAGAWLAAISGSGSALIAIHEDAEEALRLADVMARELENAQGSARALVLRADTAGAQSWPSPRGGSSS